jgi:hypothetical protein
MRLEQNKTREQLRGRVSEARALHRLLNEVTDIVEWHRYDHLWNVPLSHFALRVLLPLDLVHARSVVPDRRPFRAVACLFCADDC